MKQSLIVTVNILGPNETLIKRGFDSSWTFNIVRI